MKSSNLSDLLEAPVGAPLDAGDDFIIEAEGPTDLDEIAGKKTKSSSDKRKDVPESTSSEKNEQKKKKKKKKKSKKAEDEPEADEDGDEL